MEIIPSLSPVGGAETLFTNLAISLGKKLAERNDNDEVICVFLYKQTESFLYDKLKAAGIKMFFLNKRRGIDFICAWRLRKIIRAFKPDVIHSHLHVPLTLRMTLGPKHKKIVIFHTFHSLANKTGSPVYELFIKKILKHNWMIPIGVSNDVGNTISSFFGIHKVYVINNGIDLSSFSSSKPIKNRTIDFLCVGRFVELKNQIYAIKCFSSFIKKYPNTNLVFLGTGEKLEECKIFTENNNLKKSVIFYGFSMNVENFMSNAKILLVPSLYEGNPMVINEAMASGMFIIANNVGGIPDIVKENNGILIEPGSEDSFILAMEKAYASPKMLEKTKTVNIESSKKRSIDFAAKIYLDVFEKERMNQSVAKTNKTSILGK